VASCCECGDKPSGSCATESVTVFLVQYVGEVLPEFILDCMTDRQTDRQAASAAAVTDW
jgi:hypothetical protein